MAKSNKYLKIYNYQYVSFFMIFSTFRFTTVSANHKKSLKTKTTVYTG